MDKPLYPAGAHSTQLLTATGTQALTIANSFTIIDGKTTQRTGNLTLDLTLDAELRAGARILLKIKSAATETFTFGTGIDAPVITGVAGKTITQLFIYDGTIFYPAGTAVQVD
jgi:hypothetical protein